MKTLHFECNFFSRDDFYHKHNGNIKNKFGVTGNVVRALEENKCLNKFFHTAPFQIYNNRKTMKGF